MGALPSELSPSGATEEQSLAALDRGRQEQLAAERAGGLSAQGPYQLQLNITGDARGVAISNLTFSSGGSPITVAQGFVPVIFVPSDGTNLVHLETGKALQFHAHARPEAFFWQKLGLLAGLSLKEPKLEVNVSGTWESPKGQVALQVGEIQLPKSKTPKPTLRNLDLVLSLERERARLIKCGLLVQEQPVSLTGELPLGREFWNELRERKLPNWEEASVRLRVEHAKLAAAADLLPHFLTPDGQVDADLLFLPGGQVEGSLAIHDARTRPLGEFGPLRHIEVQLKARKRLFVFERASVDVGGSTVSFGGGVDLSGTQWLQGLLPPFQISLYGTNVPLSRQPESIIRSSFELAIVKTNGAPPIITGLAVLRDSYYLSDLKDLIPGKVATPARRPPYFSVDEPGLADWRLALRVRGPGFLRVRSSLFNGQVSADLQLQGTLKEPMALGDIKIDSGVVRFPFASLAVQQGFVSLTSENPYRPVLSVAATSKQFGYNIKMEASGPIDSPVLQFTSTPPLSSEQILLMITAGQLPAGEYAMSTQQRAQAVAVFLGRDLLSKFGVEDQAEQRLTIKSGEEITEQGRPTYEVEFKLTDHWGIVGEYDRFGDYNGMFKWRVYSK
jgi:translocation and assembly module TamB